MKKKKDKPLSIRYNGHTIRLNPINWKFEIVGNKDHDFDPCESFVDAKETIDRAIKAKQLTERRKLSLKVLDSVGNSHEVTGIHATNFTLLSKPVISNQNGFSSYYPDSEIIRSAFARMNELRSEVERYATVLSKFKIDGRLRGSSRHEPVDYDKVVSAWENLVNRMTKAADKAKLDVELDKIEPKPPKRILL